jgi:hypothetical protein
MKGSLFGGTLLAAAFGLMAGCGEQTSPGSLVHSGATRESSSSPASTTDAGDTLSQPPGYPDAFDCCMIADPLDPLPRVGCSDPVVTSCVCRNLPRCCEVAWEFACVIETLAVCGGCPIMDPQLIAALTVDSDGDGRNDMEELIEGSDPFDPVDGPDIDGDGIENRDDPDVDGDGQLNGVDHDVDGDGVMNTFDPEIDGDGLLNFIDLDDDGDGILDEYDLDQNADGIPDWACKTDEDCDDGNACNGDETCSMVFICRSGPPLNCGDGLGCTVDGCDPVSGCFHTPDDSACDDGVSCTDDSCDSASGCVHLSDDQTCDDGVECTQDRCDASLDCVHTPDHTECDDDVACTEDSCDPLLGCANAPNDNACDDNNECTEDICDPNDGCRNPLKEDAECATDADCEPIGDDPGECIHCTCIY